MKKQIKQINDRENIFVKNGIIILTIFVLAVYSQVISFSYTGFDDDFLIAKNISALSNWENLSDIFFKNSFLSDAVYGFYRPLQTLSFMWDAKLGGGELWAFHLTNFVLHLFCCYMLYFLLKRFNISKAIALIMTLIFSIHPLFAGNIAWLPARGDLLITLFGLASFLFMLNYFETKKITYLIIHLSTLFIAFLSKETALVLPLLFFIYLFIQKRKINYQIIVLAIVWIISALIWYLLRQNSINEFPDNQLFGLVPFLSNLRTIPEFIAKFIIPYNIMVLPIYQIDITIIGIIILILSIIYFIKTKIYQDNMIIFGMIWFVLLVLPGMFYSRLDTNPEQFYQYLDHRSYIALIGIILVLSSVLNKINEKISQKTFVLVGIVISIILSLISFNHTKIYSQPETFFSRAIEDNPNSSVPYFLFANVKKDEMKFEEAIKLYSSALNNNADYAEALNNRGSLYAMTSNFDLAIKDLTNAIKLNPEIPDGYYNRALSYESLGNYENAISDYKKAIEMQPNDLLIQLALANCYNVIGDYEKAIWQYGKLIETKPDYAEAYYNRANTYSLMKMSDKAIGDYGSAIKINPNYLNAFLNRAIERYETGDKNGACMDWQSAANLGSSSAKQMSDKYCK